jgi:hypothetical protein
VIVVSTSRFAAASLPVTRPIRRGSSGSGTLALEHSFGGELLLQPLERRQVVAEPEALDRERAHAVVALRLEQLGAPEHVRALAVGEVEPQRVEAGARDRHADARAIGRVLEREEDGLPARVAPELRDLSFDPDRGQAAQPVRHAAVERGDRVDLAIAVLKCLDLHTGIVRPGDRADYVTDQIRMSTAVCGSQPWPTSSTARCRSASLPCEALGEREG